MVSGKAGSALGCQPEFGGLGFWRPAARKLRPKGVFLKVQKIVKGTQNQFIITVWHWDPLKTVPRSGLENIKKQWESDRKIIDRGIRKSSLALACVRNSHLRRFSKSTKIYGNIDPKSHPGTLKTGLWGGHGRFIDHFY